MTRVTLSYTPMLRSVVPVKVCTVDTTPVAPSTGDSRRMIAALSVRNAALALEPEDGSSAHPHGTVNVAAESAAPSELPDDPAVPAMVPTVRVDELPAATRKHRFCWSGTIATRCPRW